MSGPLQVHLPVLPDLPVLNTSRVLDWERCRRKFYWSSVVGLRPRSDSTLAFGTAWHAALAALGNDRTRNLEDAAQVGIATLKTESEGIWNVEMEHEADYLQRALFEYCDEWALDEDGDEELRTTEHELFQPLGQPPQFYFAGRLDLLTWSSRRKRFLLWDHKTKGRSVSEGYFQSFDHSPQILGYLWAASQERGEPILDARINVFARLVNLRARGKPFHRYDVSFSRLDLENWAATRLRQMEAIARETQWDQTLSQCTAWNRPCEFYRLCHPTRPAWWELPEWTLNGENAPYTIRRDYVTDRTALIKEEVR